MSANPVKTPKSKPENPPPAIAGAKIDAATARRIAKASKAAGFSVPPHVKAAESAAPIAPATPPAEPSA